MNTTELKALAEKATPGPWKNVYGIVLVHWDTHPYATWLANFSVGGESMEKKLANSAFCAAANPAAILELIAQLEAAEQTARYESDLCQQALDSRKEMEGQLEDAQGEIRALRATEQNLLERVKELEEALKGIVALCDDTSGFMVDELNAAARALLEKKE